jgi:hypothetical protein
MLVSVFVFVLAAAEAAAQSVVVASGLTGPIKLDVTERGNIVVSERGTGASDGRLSIVNRNGQVQPLLDGLPSGFEVIGDPSGPTAVVVRGCCVLELAIGEGDTLRFPGGMPGPVQIPNPSPTSPLFSAVLRIVFKFPLDQLMGGFSLTRANLEVLADGLPVHLQNVNGEDAWVRLVSDLKDFRQDDATNVRGSNPFGMTRGKLFDALLIADGGANSLVQLGALGPPKTLLRFAQVDIPSGGKTDAVPTSVRHYKGDQYLVTLFAGLPFAPGSASVRLVDIATQTEKPLITGLWTVTDVLVIDSAFYVLEMFAGRLVRFATPTSTPVTVATDLITPTSMAYAPRQRAIYIAELAGGRISRVDL